jgi:hypothetical protein
LYVRRQLLHGLTDVLLLRLHHGRVLPHHLQKLMPSSSKSGGASAKVCSSQRDPP